jgi:TatD DNase family protein
MPEIVDTHAHLTDERLLSQLDAILVRAAGAGVCQVIVVGTTAGDSALGLELARSRPGLFAAVGIQPNVVAEAQPGDWERVEALARSGLPIALGETGLDRYWDRTPFPAQQEMFQRHVDLALELDLPVIIHCRECELDIIEQLGRLARPIRGVLHSFTGEVEHARAFVELGLHVSYAGMVTFPKPDLDALRATAAGVPADCLLVETDSPYLAPQPQRGRTNEPAHVVHTLRTLAEVRRQSLEELARITTENARRLFRLPAEETLQTIPRGGGSRS